MKKLSMLCFVLSVSALAEERPVSPEMLAAIESGGELNVERPKNLPDYTKGDPVPQGKYGPMKPWNLGPSGIVGVINHEFKGDQILVSAILKGSPAEGKVLKGDVVVGMNGKRFEAGGHLGYQIGKAIIEAEKEANGGKISFMMWRDLNLIARSGPKDVTSVDIDEIFSKARDDNSLYEWKSEDARTSEALGFDEFPINGSNYVASLTLNVLPEYSDTAPYDCPKTERILEDAWKVLAKRFVEDPNVRRSGRGGIIEAFALVSSGKAEYLDLVREWVRGKHSPWHPPKEPIGARFKPGYRGYNGYQSWHHGFGGLYCALYYEATGDEYVLPALRKYAIEAAMGQSRGGSWGHTFAFPQFNGGELHRMNPGYGALNAAGNRCFFLITLAQKLGIDHPEIDLAVGRAHRYFNSYVDLGAIPYGDFGAAATDDSNGKNTGIAFSMKLLGNDYGAKYFGMMSSHCAFTRRGGHGHDYHGNWSSWAATMCGPEVRIANERNFRWRRTLCRTHNGSFVYQSPTQYGPLRDPTATEVLHQAVAKGYTLITGKDPNPKLYPNAEEFDQLLASAQPQLNDAELIERAGTPWRERSTDDVFKLINIFKPKARGQVAAELAKRYQAGEKEIVPRLAQLMDQEDARTRDGACAGLIACGKDAALQYQSKIIGLLDAPEEFVRIRALNTLGKITIGPDAQVAMLKATAREFTYMGAAPNSLRSHAQSVLFKGEHELAKSPFEAGYDEELVQVALEKLIALDPMGNRPFLAHRKGVWSKDTVVRLAGPLIHTVANPQIVDQMFNGRRQAAVALMEPFGYQETLEASANMLWKRDALPRQIRGKVSYKLGLIDIDLVKQYPGAFKHIVDPLKNWIADDPLAKISVKVGKETIDTNVEDLINRIEAAPEAPLPTSLAKEVEQWFVSSVQDDALAGYREVLKDPSRNLTFRQMTALSALAKQGELTDLLRYVSHPDRRLRLHTRKLLNELSDITPALVKAMASDQLDKAGLLVVLRTRGDAAALPAARKALTHADPAVRGEAIQTVFALGADAALIDVFKQLRAATDSEELDGCEKALLSRRDDAVHAQKTVGACIALLPKSEEPVRDSLYWVLANLGGPEALAALEEAAKNEVDDAAFDRIIEALSFAPDLETNELLIRLMRGYPERAERIANVGARRLVIGPDGIGTLTDDEKMDFAGPLLKMVLDKKLITYLARVRTGRCMIALQDAMRRGAVDTATVSIIAAAEGMAEAPAKDRERAADALKDVIEYIEVTQLRGGPEAHDHRYYPMWKTRSERAGKALLKVFKPETAPLPEFDDLDLDL